MVDAPFSPRDFHIELLDCVHNAIADAHGVVASDLASSSMRYPLSRCAPKAPSPDISYRSTAEAGKHDEYIVRLPW